MHFAELEIPNGPTGVAAARRWAVSHCRDWGFSDASDDVALLVSELVTNAVLYAGRPVHLHVAQPDSLFRVEVCDSDPRPPQAQQPDVLSERGRGLLLLDELASAWGVDIDDPGGKVVWFEMTHEDLAS